MSAAFLRRFVILMILLIVAVVGFQTARDYFNPPPGDFETRQGDIHLGIEEWDEAIEDFDRALEAQPDHRGALMGRAIAFLQSGRHAEAEAEFNYLIGVLEDSLEPDDSTGRGVLAAAYANLGILYDRDERYQDALDNYVKSLQVDAEVVEGPGVIHKILYDANPSTVRDRAQYIYEQLQLPEDERLMKIPPLDAEQRMHKP